MKKSELEYIKNECKVSLQKMNQYKQRLETEMLIQLYLGSLKSIQEEQKHYEFLKKLEFGEDETVFSPYDAHSSKSSMETHFGLSSLLEYAFDLKIKTYLQGGLWDPEICFDQFFNYVENAKEILTDMNYFPGDKLVPNEFGLEVYANPRNYSVVDLTSLLPMTDSQLKSSYNALGIHITEDYFVLENEGVRDLKKSFTAREREAFYGEGAKRALGISPVKVKTKRK